VVTAYTIEIENSNNLWQGDVSCDGANAVIVSGLSCVVPMDTLTQSFGLVFDELVYVRISATNVLGTGSWS